MRFSEALDSVLRDILNGIEPDPSTLEELDIASRVVDIASGWSTADGAFKSSQIRTSAGAIVINDTGLNLNNGELVLNSNGMTLREGDIGSPVLDESAIKWWDENDHVTYYMQNAKNAADYNSSIRSMRRLNSAGSVLAYAEEGFYTFDNGDAVTRLIMNGRGYYYFYDVAATSGGAVVWNINEEYIDFDIFGSSGLLFASDASLDAIGIGGDADADYKLRVHGNLLADNVREKLSANRTYYVRTDGSDSNNGLTNSAGGAFLTIQQAIDTASALDVSIYDVTIQLGAGTYTSTGNTLKQVVGAGNVIILGDETTPANVVVNVGSNETCFAADTISTVYHLRGMKLTGTSALFGISALAATVKFQNINFGATFNVQIRALQDGGIVSTGNYTISGNSSYHWRSSRTGVIWIAGETVTLSGTPAFTVFARADELSEISAYSNSYSGSATGKRYEAIHNSLIFTNGGATTLLPGNTAGSTATGGQYA